MQEAPTFVEASPNFHFARPGHRVNKPNDPRSELLHRTMPEHERRAHRTAQSTHTHVLREYPALATLYAYRPGMKRETLFISPPSRLRDREA